MSTRAAAVIAAAGAGRRLGGVRKQYVELAGEPLLLHALRPFLEHAAVEWIVVALPEHDAARPPRWLDRLDARLRIVAGGTERRGSVRRGLAAVPDAADVVLVHDAARPLVTRAIIERTLAAAANGGSAVPAVPVTDTIKAVDANRCVVETLDRRRLWHAQTPQAFPRALLVEAHRSAAVDGVDATDDAALVERYGGTVVVVEGDADNVKVTSPADLVVVEALLRARGG